jgi:hypothetical protein
MKKVKAQKQEPEMDMYERIIAGKMSHSHGDYDHEKYKASQMLRLIKFLDAPLPSYSPKGTCKFYSITQAVGVDYDPEELNEYVGKQVEKFIKRKHKENKHG